MYFLGEHRGHPLCIFWDLVIGYVTIFFTFCLFFLIFSWYKIPSCKCTTFSLSFHQLINAEVVSIHWILRIQWQWALMYKDLCGIIQGPLGICKNSGAELYCTSSELVSIVTAWDYITSEEGFCSSHILVNICFLVDSHFCWGRDGISKQS